MAGSRWPVFIALLLLACGGSTNDSRSGSVGGGGGPGSLTPRPAQAGLRLALAAATPVIAGKSCPVNALHKEVGDPAPTETDPGLRIVDGEDDAQISCSVMGSGTFDIYGSIAVGSTLFRVTGRITAGAGTAEVRVYTPETTTLGSPYAACTLDAGTGSMQAQSGAVWAHFECPALLTEPSTACAASGVFVFENCEE